MREKIIDTDVLVIGGGMAGCFAAIKAKEKGAQVVLVDKGFVSRSGQTRWAGGFAVFHPDWDHDLDAWLNQVNICGEYINNREWTKTIFSESYARYKDLDSWGVEFEKLKSPPAIESFSPRVTEALCIVNDHSSILRKQVLNRGIKIFDRIMLTDLIAQNCRVVAAIGFPTDRLESYVFKAKATITCTGAGGFKPYGSWPIGNLTFDGHSMAYRIGAEISGKEFEDYHGHSPKYPLSLPGSESLLKMPRVGLWGEVPPGLMKGKLYTAKGKELFLREDLSPAYEAHSGNWPFKDELGNDIKSVCGAAPGLSIHATEGVWPVSLDCASNIPGLYAAGDCLATMLLGAYYSVGGGALANASVTGTRAGIAAANFAKKIKQPDLEKDKVRSLNQCMFEPLERKGGFTPRWVTHMLRNIMIPYYILYVKHDKRLKAALTLVEYLRDHLIPKLFARDAHELRLAHETKNMVLNAEMKLRASLFRTESRGTHYREDYPQRDDPNWLAWVILKEQNGKMQLVKRQVPKEWWPDLSKPYKKRYQLRFPGE